jgi:hypothetical protein
MPKCLSTVSNAENLSRPRLASLGPETHPPVKKPPRQKYLLPVAEYLSTIAQGELDDAQEMAVEMYVEQLKEILIAIEVTDQVITSCANSILRNAHEGDGQPKTVDSE